MRHLIGLAIIGFGWMGRVHARCLQGREDARLVAVADRNDEALSAVREYGGAEASPDYRKVLKRNDVDAVIVATPATSHFEIVKASIEAGKHVICEKPLAMNRREANAVRQLVRSSGLVFMVDFPQRYAVSSQEVRLSVDAGLLGPIEYIRANFRFSMKKHGVTHGAWVFDRDQAGGLILEASVHLWDTVRYLSDQEVIEVVAVAHEATVRGKPLEDSFVAIARLDGGGIACIDMSGSLPEGFPTDKRFEIIGRHGTAYIDDFRHYLAMASDQGVEANPGEKVSGFTYPDVMWHSQLEGGVKRLQREFVRCVREGLEPVPNVEDGARACEISWAVMNSLKSGRLEAVTYG